MKVEQSAICGSNTLVADKAGNRIWAVRVQIHLPIASYFALALSCWGTPIPDPKPEKER